MIFFFFFFCEDSTNLTVLLSGRQRLWCGRTGCPMGCFCWELVRHTVGGMGWSESHSVKFTCWQLRQLQAGGNVEESLLEKSPSPTWRECYSEQPPPQLRLASTEDINTPSGGKNWTKQNTEKYTDTSTETWLPLFILTHFGRSINWLKFFVAVIRYHTLWHSNFISKNTIYKNNLE